MRTIVANPENRLAFGTTERLGGNDSAREPFREAREGWLVLGVVWLASAVYLSIYLGHGWVPVDVGTLGQMAERVLLGQMPYRDFVEVYTGGLTYLNALAFRLFGVNVLSMRITLYLFFLGWVPSVYFIARRFAGPLGAGAITLLSMTWSVPNYPEAVPSWYNLYFATWGMLALIRYTETERKRWLWIAGVCGGLSFLAKVSGLFFAAAALLFFVFRELSLRRNNPHRSEHEGTVYRLFASAGLLAFLAAVTGLISQRPTPLDFFYFVLPSAALVAFLLWGIWRSPSERSTISFRRLFLMTLPFLAGVIAPVAMFLLWYVKEGALGAWFYGVFVLSMKRMHWAALNPPPLRLLLGLLPVALALLACYARKRARLVAACIVLALAVFMILSWQSTAVYGYVGNSLPLLVPLAAIGVALWMARVDELGDRTRQQVFLMVAVVAVFSLIEFPYAATIYFCYIAPLVVLAVAALLLPAGGFKKFPLAALVVFFLAFAVWLGTPGYLGIFHLSVGPPDLLTYQRLDLSRGGGIRVTKVQAREYEALVSAVRSHARGPYIYAAVDSPQVYFLSGERNPTGTIWDFLDPDFLDSSRTSRILKSISNHNVTVVVLRNDPTFSGNVPPDLRKVLDARFPYQSQIGNFEVRWK